MSYFSKTVIDDAKKHARKEFPKESCGLVVAGKYIPCINVAEDPLNDFMISPFDVVSASEKGIPEGVIHSHPNGPFFPSQTDMKTQIAMNIPWAIIALDDERIGDPIEWGGNVPIPPLIGRQFMHGVTDCYSVVRDAFRLGKEGMAAQGMPDWPFDPIFLDEVARDDNWWKGDDDLYTSNFKNFGFVVVNMADAKPGDVWMKAIGNSRSNPGNKLNHAGILVSFDQIAHHMPERLSRREPSGLWGRAADLWIRYVGKQNA